MEELQPESPRIESDDPDMPLCWVGEDGTTHWATLDHAVEVLRWFYDEWPGGMSEVLAAQRKGD